MQHSRAREQEYRVLGERALAQMSDAALNQVPAAEANSAAMIVRHLGGNLVSRFTDFLTADGEKPWRDRDAEFEARAYSRDEVDAWWRRGWDVVEGQLAGLAGADLTRTVTIRGQPLTVHAALTRSVTRERSALVATVIEVPAATASARSTSTRVPPPPDRPATDSPSTT